MYAVHHASFDGFHICTFKVCVSVCVCVCVCVCVMVRVFWPVSCALIILPGVVVAQQIIHGPANPSQETSRLGLYWMYWRWGKSEVVLMYAVHLLMHVFVLCRLGTNVLTKHRIVWLNIFEICQICFNSQCRHGQDHYIRVSRRVHDNYMSSLWSLVLNEEWLCAIGTEANIPVLFIFTHMHCCLSANTCS